MIRDRELHKVTGDSFVPKNRPRIFDRGTQVKILRLRIVGGNKKEPDRVLIVNPRWIHEAARPRGFHTPSGMPRDRAEHFSRAPDWDRPWMDQGVALRARDNAPVLRDLASLLEPRSVVAARRA